MRANPALRAVCFLAVAFVVLSPASRAADFDEAKLALIRPGMQRFVDDHQIAGAVTVAGTAKGIARLEAIGQRRLDTGDAMPKDALFRIASMTKPITAVGILILADEGKLSVDDPVEKHLPEFRGQMLVAERKPDQLTLKKTPRPITLRDLLTHTSGVPGYPSGLDRYGKRYRTLAESTLALSQRPLEFAPGSRWSYSNTGINTLGSIIEVVSGMDYETFLAERVFKPLRMKDTTFRPSKEQLSRLAGMYGISKDGKLTPVPDAPISRPAERRHPSPAGGLYSTGADQAQFYRMMLNGGTLDGERILSEKSVKAMTRVQTGELKCGFTPGMSHGLGFAVVREPQGVTAMLSPGSFGHGGAFGTQSWADPKRGLFVILLIQRTGLPNSDASDMRRELQRLVVEAALQRVSGFWRSSVASRLHSLGFATPGLKVAIWRR
jgi:CubicO group peptidase (beta-lactamase class C family)